MSPAKAIEELHEIYQEIKSTIAAGSPESMLEIYQGRLTAIDVAITCIAIVHGDLKK